MQESHLRYYKDLNSDDFAFIEKSGESWESEYRSTPNAIEGSPDLFLRVYGDSIAKFFGYEKIGENILRIPRVAYFNRQLTKLNEKLSPRQRCLLSFYETGEGTTSPLQHLRNFHETCALPIASEGTVAIHDSTYHFGGVFIPEACLATILNQLDLFLKFVDHAEQHGAPVDYINEMIFEMSLNIDSATGNFTAFLAQPTPPKISAYWILSREGHPANMFVPWFAKAVRKDRDLGFDLDRCLVDFEKTIPALYKVAGPSPEEYEKLCREKIEVIRETIERWS